MSHRGFPHTAVWGQIPELLAESSKVSQTWCLLAGTLCWGSVALGTGVGLLVGDLFPAVAGCRAGCCCLPASGWSWFLGSLTSGLWRSPEVGVLGHWWMGLGTRNTRAGAYSLMGKTGPGASDDLLWAGTRSQGL